MTIRYFKKIRNRVTRLEWLTERVSIDTEYDEDADAGIIGGSIISPDKGRVEIKGRVGALIEIGAGFHPMLAGSLFWV